MPLDLPAAGTRIQDQERVGAIMHAGTRMEKQVLSAFKSACAQGRWDAAESLLHALEILHPAPSPGSSLARAYGLIAAAPVSLRQQESFVKRGGRRRPADA